MNELFSKQTIFFLVPLIALLLALTIQNSKLLNLEYNNIEKNKTGQFDFDFNADITFLDNLINHLYEYEFTKIALNTAASGTNGHVNSEGRKELVALISVSVDANMSHDYKKRLLHYFTQEGLALYIGRKVDLIAMHYAMEKNKPS